MTYDEFYNCIEQLPKEVTKRDLEAYLSALYRIVTPHESTPFSPTLCLELLKKAFMGYWGGGFAVFGVVP